ncbi:putative tail lysin [Lactobacillus phage Lb338-1]|uniref:Putative tail lysin n=1 Tax=Lactobacillus phage Lb338-1 TaxID=2892342 RepID=C1KFN0_9CAUD|nr:tail associated lysin [Lactobacillus phage Lb338-1]ACO37041.1 putative tail lysin [Lactobacillus phage Lb338-1]
MPDRQINFNLQAKNDDAIRKAKEAENQFKKTGSASKGAAQDAFNEWSKVTDQLKQAYSIVGKMSDRARYITGNSQQAYHREYNTSGINSSYSSNMNSLNSNIKSLSDVLKSQSNIVSKSLSRNHMTDTQYRDYQANRKILGGASNDSSNQRKNLDGMLKERGLLAKSRDNATSKDERVYYNEKLRENNQEIKAQRDFIKKIDQATNSIGKFDSSLQGVQVDPERNSLAYNMRQRGYMTGVHISAGAAQAVSGYYQQGRSINQQTGQQAIQIGYLTGGGTDYQVRSQAQKLGSQYGYKTQDALDFYSQVIRRPGKAMSMSEANKDVAGVMAEGRKSNLSEDTYKNLVTSVAGAGGDTSKTGIKNIVSTVLAANAMSGQSGNYEQSTQTLTTLLNQISTSTNVSNQGVKNLANNQATLSSLGSGWKGNAGAAAEQTMNSAYTAASTGNNSGLLYTIIRSKGQGGPQGYLNAEIQSAKGLSDVNNITDARKMFQRQAQSGPNGLARTAVSLQKLFPNMAPQAAKDLASGIADGKLSDKQLQKRAQEADKKAREKNKNKTYDKSDQSTINQKDSRKEKNQSNFQQSNNWFEQLTSTIGGTMIGGLGLEMFKGLGKGIVTNISGGGIKSVISKLTGKSFGEEAKGGSGLFSGIKNLFSGGSKVAEGAEATTKSTGLFSKIVGGAKSLFGVGESAAKSGSKGTSIFSKMTGGISKFLTTGSLLSKIGLGALGLQGSIPDSKKLSKSETNKLTAMYGYDKNGKKSISKKASSKKSSSSSSKSSSSKSSYSSTQKYISYKQQNSLLDKEKQIVDNRLKYTKEQQSLLAGNGKNSDAKNTSVKSSSRSHRAFGGLVKGHTEIDELNKPEFVVPGDPAKQNSTQRVVNDIANMTGVRAKTPSNYVVNSGGSYSPNVTVNVNGQVDNNTLSNLQEKIKSALNDATDNYRKQIVHG